MKRVALLGLLAVLALTGCGGEPDPGLDPSGQLQLELLDDLYSGRFDDAYDLLHPEHQKLVSREHFERCGRQTIPVGGLESLEILSVEDRTIQIPVLGEQEAKAVRIGLRLGTGESGTFTNHSVKVDDRWVWVLNQDAVRAYEAGRCPT